MQSRRRVVVRSKRMTHDDASFESARKILLLHEYAPHIPTFVVDFVPKHVFIRARPQLITKLIARIADGFAALEGHIVDPMTSIDREELTAIEPSIITIFSLTVQTARI